MSEAAARSSRKSLSDLAYSSSAVGESMRSWGMLKTIGASKVASELRFAVEVRP